VTLRHDIHNAIDGIAPPASTLARQVVASLASAGKTTRPISRNKRNPWLAGLGRTGSLAAAILVVLLIATLVVGVRVWRDRNAFNPSPAGPASNETEVARLQARPLILPSVPPGGACPILNNTVTGITEVPISVNGAGVTTTTNWGDYFDPTYVVPRTIKGIVLIRIRDLKTGQAGVFVGPYAAGDVVGTDTIDGKTVDHHGFAALDMNHPPARSSSSNGYWDIRQGWAAGWSGCWGFQLDGPDFSEVITGETATTRN
jgi:hypothetical protein